MYMSKLIEMFNDEKRWAAVQYAFLNKLILHYFDKGDSFTGDYKQVCYKMQDYITLKVLRGETSREKIFKVGETVARLQYGKALNRRVRKLTSKLYLSFLLDTTEKMHLAGQIRGVCIKHKWQLYIPIPAMDTSWQKFLALANL